MRLARMQQTQHIAALLQLVIKILMVAGGCLHPNEDLLGESIELAQFLFPDLPTFPALANRIGLTTTLFVGPTNATRTGLASNINPTDILDACFL